MLLSVRLQPEVTTGHTGQSRNVQWEGLKDVIMKEVALKSQDGKGAKRQRQAERTAASCGEAEAQLQDGVGEEG